MLIDGLCCFLLLLLLGRLLLSPTEVLVKNHEVVRLRTVLSQIEVLAEEAKQFGRGSIVGVLVRRQILILHHELKNAKSNTLPLQALMHVEVEHAPRVDLLHRPTGNE